MRFAIVLLALAASVGSTAAAQQLQQTVKYTLIVVAGVSDASRRDGVAMSATGIYPGRQECEAAGGGIKYGVVNPTEGQPSPTITWICVPLGKP